MVVIEMAEDEEMIPVLKKTGSWRSGPIFIKLNRLAPVTIGRDVTVTYLIKSEYLSRKHAFVRHDGHYWTIRDVGSRNGTYVNRRKLMSESAVPLHDGDKVGLGMPVENQYRDDSLVYRLCREKESVVNGTTRRSRTQSNENDTRQHDVAVGDERLSCMINGTETTIVHQNEMESARQPRPGPSSSSRISPPKDDRVVAEAHSSSRSDERSQFRPRKKKRIKLDKIPLLKLQRCDDRGFVLPSGLRLKSYETEEESEDKIDLPRRVHFCFSVTHIKTEKTIPTSNNASVSEEHEVIDLCSEDDDNDEEPERNRQDVDALQDATVSASLDVDEEHFVESDGNQDSDSDGAISDFRGYSQEDEVIILSDDDENVVLPNIVVKEEVHNDILEVEEDEWSSVFRTESSHSIKKEIFIENEVGAIEDEVEVEPCNGDYSGDSIERIVGELHGEIVQEDDEQQEEEEASKSRLLDPEDNDESEASKKPQLIPKDTDDDRTNLPIDVHDFFPMSQLLSDDEEPEGTHLLRETSAKVVEKHFVYEVDDDIPLYDLVPNEAGDVSPDSPSSSTSDEENKTAKTSEYLEKSLSKPSTSFYSHSDDTKKKFQIDRLKLSGKSTIVSGIGATMLTKAQPMPVGRRCSSNTMSKPSMPPQPPPPSSPQHQTEKRPIKRPPKAKLIALPSTVAKQKGQMSSLKKNVMNKYGNRIRAPGGGSAVPSGTKSPKKHPIDRFPPSAIRRPSNDADDEQPTRRNSYEDVIQHAAPKEKVPHKVPQRAATSRGDRLAEAMIHASEADKQVPLKRKPMVPLVSALPMKRCKPTPIETRTLRLSSDPSSSNGRNPSPSLRTERSRHSSASSDSSRPSAKRVAFSDVNQTRLIESRASKEKRSEGSSSSTMSPILERDFSAPRLDLGRNALNGLREMLVWNPTWLEEQRRLKSSPPIVEERRLIKVANKFNTTSEYVKTYLPLVLLETWESISKRWTKTRGKLPEYSLVISGIRNHGEGKDKVLLIDCYAIVKKSDENSDECLQSGWFTILRVPVKSNQTGTGNRKTHFVSLFAYVDSCRKSSYSQFQRRGFVPPLLSRVAAQITGEKTLLTVTIITKEKQMDIEKNSFFKIVMLAKMRKTLQQIETMYNISKTKLGEALLSPKVDLCTLPFVNPQRRMFSVGDTLYNTSQRHAVLRVTEACITNMIVPKVSLIQGPPGTGKTAVVVALITQLLYGDHVSKGFPKPHILLCAPSNNAVDEDVCRLMDIKTTERIRIVRLGQTDQVHSRISSLRTESHVDYLDKTMEQLGKDMNKMTAEIESFRSKLNELKKLGQMGEVAKLRKTLGKHETKLAEKEAEYQKLRENPFEDGRSCQVTKDDLLMKADVIATTLGSCSHHGMEVFMNNQNRPLICIIDEATQCVEPDLIQLLYFGVTKLVLVGDPQQLPATVLSNKASTLGYQQSLFHRLYDTFKECVHSPVLLLDIQYRMHPDIARFPSIAFYKGKLKNDINLVNKYAAVPFVPYKVFDVCDSCEQTEGDSYWNTNEATFVLRLAETLLQVNKKLNIGIISFYSKQKQLIHEIAKEREVLKEAIALATIEINTVDSFQGREKDVIIVSAVRSSGNLGFLKHHQRLNVAITRAKSALYICGCVNSLKQAPHWKNLICDAMNEQRFVKVSSRIAQNVLHDIVVKNAKKQTASIISHSHNHLHSVEIVRNFTNSAFTSIQPLMAFHES